MAFRQSTIQLIKQCRFRRIHHVPLHSSGNGRRQFTSLVFGKNKITQRNNVGLFLSSMCAIAAASTLVTDFFDSSQEKYTLMEESPSLLSSKLIDGDGDDDETEDEETTTVINWSGTHTIEVPNKFYFEPESVSELESIVAKCQKDGIPIRPVGSALSPNAISFQPMGMVSMANLDQIIAVDKEKMTVTVQAGARVSQVVDALRPHGLTLPNLASIAEQQMGGFIQIGAHGTGANIAPVDDFVTSLTLVTPERGTVTLTPSDGEMFDLVKVGLGCVGIVGEITMQCIPSHNLLEHTYVLTRKEAKAQLNNLLKKHKHIRYMWIPYQDAVVVVTNDPEDESSSNILKQSLKKKLNEVEDDKTKPMKDLLKKLSKHSKTPYTDEMLDEKGFGELRDALLAFNPMSGQHVELVNRAEAEFWKQSEGYQLKPSDQLLQFDCGGQQWVLEVCFPTGTYDRNNGNDLQFMEDLMAKIESESIPAHAPIEQRWSASSSSFMSPAHGIEGGLHCWIGIIMYLPSDDMTERTAITATFKGQYCDLAREVGAKYDAVSHWGKLEMPLTDSNLVQLRSLMESRYPLGKFNSARLYYDSKNLLSNDLLNTVLGKPK